MIPRIENRGPPVETSCSRPYGPPATVKNVNDTNLQIFNPFLISDCGEPSDSTTPSIPTTV